MALNKNTNLVTLQYGDYIPCRYTNKLNGVVGYFSELGNCVATEISKTASAGTNDGLFNFIYAGLDASGKMILIGDRNIQTLIAPSALISSGISSTNGLLNPRNFTFVDGNGATGINYNTAKNANNSNACVYNNELYYTWCEVNSTCPQIRVKKYNGTSYISVDGGDVNGLNYNNTKITNYPNLCVYNNELYCAWVENNASSIQQVRVKKYDGTAWTFVDGNGVNGLNYNPSYTAYNLSLYVYNNELYCAWSENNASSVNQIRVKKYNGTTWAFVDGNGANGLNYDVTKSVSGPNMYVYNNELYCVWPENNSTTNQIRIKKWNGTIWSSVDGNGTTGLNYNTSYGVSYPFLYMYNNELYCTWAECLNTGITQIRVKKYNGTTWTFVDGNGTNGLNYNTGQNAVNPIMCVYNNELYCTWSETNSNNYIRVKKYDGTTWTFVDNNTPYGISYGTSTSSQYSHVINYNNELYCFWHENTSSTNQIRIKKFSLQFNGTYKNASLRLLTGGTVSTDTNCEWVKYIVNSTLNNTITAGDNTVWNWTTETSITSTQVGGNTMSVIRGGTAANTYSSTSNTNSTSTMGFRPVLIVELINYPPVLNSPVKTFINHSKKVQLSATSISDPEGNTLKYKVSIKKPNNSVIIMKDYDTDFQTSPVLFNTIVYSINDFDIGTNSIIIDMIDSLGNASQYITNISKSGSDKILIQDGVKLKYINGSNLDIASSDYTALTLDDFKSLLLSKGMNTNIKLTPEMNNQIENPDNFKIIVGKLQYLS